MNLGRYHITWHVAKDGIRPGESLNVGYDAAKRAELCVGGSSVHRSVVVLPDFNHVRRFEGVNPGYNREQ